MAAAQQHTSLGKSNIHHFADIKSLQTMAEVEMIKEFAANNQNHLDSITETTEALCNLCIDLSTRLAKERDKSAKLRRHLAKASTEKKAPSALTNSDLNKDLSQAKLGESELEQLLKQQSDLLEKLYQENSSAREEIEQLKTNNQQLLTANERLRLKNIQLRKEQKQSLQHITKTDNNTSKQKAETEATDTAESEETNKDGSWLSSIITNLRDELETKRAKKTAAINAEKRVQSRKKQAPKQEVEQSEPVDADTAWLMKNSAEAQ